MYDEDEELDRIHAIGETIGIKYSQWCYEDITATQLHMKHPFTASYVDASCYCYKGSEVVPLVGDTWLDVWKSIETYCKRKNCDHTFIESIKQKGDILRVHCGS